MKVTLIAQTEMEFRMPESVRDTYFGEYMDNFLSDSSADELAHFAGRSCYQAWDMPRRETAHAMGYLDNIIKQGHFSVLEHASATFYIEGVSRNLTHELIRHRHLSYSELSQRFVDMSTANTVTPPAFRDMHPTLVPLDEEDKERYEALVRIFTSKGLTRKEAREAARFYLPNNVETKIVVTGNHRAWRDMLHKRYSVHADAEIRELATKLLRKLKEVAPATYQDFPDEPFN